MRSRSRFLDMLRRVEALGTLATVRKMTNSVRSQVPLENLNHGTQPPATLLSELRIGSAPVRP